MPETAELLARALADEGQVDLCQFTVVERLNFVAVESDSTQYDLELVMARVGRGGARISLKFERVSGLKLDSFGGGLTQITGLYVKDIARNGWDNQRFEIGDYENSRIFFCCWSVSISGMGNARS